MTLPPLEPGFFSRALASIPKIEPMRWTGVVTEVVGTLICSRGPVVSIGDFCEISTANGRAVRAQVVGFRNGQVLSLPLEPTHGLQLGDVITARGGEALARVGPELKGRLLDGFGCPIDAGPPLHCRSRYLLDSPPRSPLEREHITEQLATGVRVVDALLACGKGQRIGVFGGSGVGKSTLLATMARYTTADINVIALIGERNREVREFVDQELGAEGLARSVVVVATSDQPAPLRVRACFLAMAIAEYFRDGGNDVLFVMDSVTRLAMAQREISLAAGEPPSQKGYTPSVFQLLPKLFERAGNFRSGSITGFFTVLVEGDDFNEPICDASRAILDGHIILSRELASAGHYPAIDVLHSISRLASKIVPETQTRSAQAVREALALYERSRELIHLGAYAAGSNPKLDLVIRNHPRILQYLRQRPTEPSELLATNRELKELAAVLAL
jgi:flagellum-specific ATP synthase